MELVLNPLTTVTEGSFHYIHTGSYRLIDQKIREIDPVLFINGGFQEMKSWNSFANYFLHKTLVILTDIPGTGSAENVTLTTPLSYQAHYILKLLRHLNIKKINVVAASYGTPIAINLAQIDEEIVSHLVLVGPMKTIPKDGIFQVQKAVEFLEAKDTKGFSTFFRNKIMALDRKDTILNFDRASRLFDLFVRMNEHKRQQYIINSKRLLNFEGFNFTKKISVPTLVFTGEYDPFTKPEFCLDIAKGFTNATYTTVKDTDHMVHVENFESCLSLLIHFFNDLNFENVKGINPVIRLNEGKQT